MVLVPARGTTTLPDVVVPLAGTRGVGSKCFLTKKGDSLGRLERAKRLDGIKLGCSQRRVQAKEDPDAC